MNKKLFYGFVVSFCLVTLLAAALNSALATRFPPATDQNVPPASTTVGNVIVSLPPGGGALAGRPTDIRLVIYDYNATRNYTDALFFYVWIPSLNIYNPMAIILDQPPVDQMKAVWNNTAIYLEVNGTVIRNNFKIVADNQLDVWVESAHGDEDTVLNANLTVPVALDFTNLPPAVFGTNLTVPAMALMFRGVADSFYHQETFTLQSGFKITTTHYDVPAWVRINIPTWIGGQTETSGTILVREVTVVTPPT